MPAKSRRSLHLPAVDRTVSLREYIRAVRMAKHYPDAEFKHGLTTWWPVTGREGALLTAYSRPKTGDGFPIVPGRDYWFWTRRSGISEPGPYSYLLVRVRDLADSGRIEVHLSGSHKETTTADRLWFNHDAAEANRKRASRAAVPLTCHDCGEPITGSDLILCDHCRAISNRHERSGGR